MSKPFYLDIKGIKEIQDKLIKAGARVKSEVREELKDGSERVVLKQKNKVRQNSFDQGTLARGLRQYPTGDLEFDIVSTAPHSPYVNWGTKKRAKIPAKEQSYAAQFKGLKTGSADEALFAITAWVKRKGIRFDSASTFKSGKRKGGNKKLTLEQTAYIIFHHLMIHGMRARPFFFEPFDEESPIILKNITTVLGDIL